MKTQKLIIIALVALIISCKKESDKASKCRVSSVVQAGGNGGQIFTFTYNEQGKLTAIDLAGGSKEHKDLSWQGNTLYVITLNKDGNFIQKDSIALDDKERPLNIRTFYSTDESVYTNTAFEYNGDELLKTVQIGVPGGSTTTTNVTNTNGNPTMLTVGNSISIIEYYTDKKMQKGDYLDLAAVIQYGIGIYPHKNLVKMIASGNTLTNFVYEFNGDGLISKTTATSGNQVSILTYTYECD